MNSPYPFDPTDWTTITPLFEALIAAPIPPDGLMDWLEQWNQLDIAVWDAYTTLKRPAYYDMGDHDAERVYQGYVQALYSTYLGLTNGLISRALALQPEPPTPAYQQLWRRWQNQADLFQPASLPIQAEISQLEGSYREQMRQVEQLPGNPVAHWLERRNALNELMLRLLTLRRALARTSGQPTFLAYRWRELNRLDYSIDDCQSFHRAVEQTVVPLLASMRAHNARRPAMPQIAEPDTLRAGVARILNHIDPSFGEMFRAMDPDYLDFGTRPGKAVTSEQWFFPGTGMPYLHVASTNLATILHESGHAAHVYLSFRSQHSMWNLSGPEEFEEFAAVSMELLGWPYYTQEQGGLYNTAENEVARASVLQLYLDVLASCVMQDAFEHWIYSEAPEAVTPAALDAKWLQLKGRFQPWELDAMDAEEAMTGWQRWNWSLFRMPLYMITYPFATVGACQLGQLAELDRQAVVQNYKTALRLGNTKSLPELFSVVGLNFPFTQQAVENAVQFVIEQSLRRQ